MDTHNKSGGEHHQGNPGLPKGLSSGMVRSSVTETESNMSIETASPVDYAAHILRLVLSELADEPGNIRMEKKSLGAFGTAFDIILFVNRTDYGNVNGSRGAHIEGLRSICKRISDRTGKEITLNMVEVDAGTKVRRGFMVPDPDWNRSGIEFLMQQVFDAVFEECKVAITDDGMRGGSVLEVVTSDKTKEATVLWIKEKLTPIIVQIGIKNRRHLRLTVTRDQMLFDHAHAV